MVLKSAKDNYDTITLIPNCSAEWRHLRWFILLLITTSVLIGILWAITGLWLILPFCGAEAALAAYLIYRVCENSHQRQIVCCDDHSINVHSGPKQPQQTWRFQRTHTTLVMEQPIHQGRHPSLILSDRDQQVRLGEFLTDDDKRAAFRLFRALGIRCRTHQPHCDAV